MESYDDTLRTHVRCGRRQKARWFRAAGLAQIEWSEFFRRAADTYADRIEGEEAERREKEGMGQ